MTNRPRRQMFPGVPAPGGPDADATHVWPGLADELRAEGAPRRDPALAEPISFETSSAPDVREGETVRVAVPGITGPDDEGVRLRVDEKRTDPDGSTHVTLTPLDGLPDDPLTGAPEDGQPREPSSWFLGLSDSATEADVWGGDQPGVGHLGLGQSEVQGTAPELAAALAVSDGTAPEGDGPEWSLPGWPIGTPATGLPEGGVPEPAGSEPHPDDEPGADGETNTGEYRAETTDDGEGIAVTMPCGCAVVLRPCR